MIGQRGLESSEPPKTPTPFGRLQGVLERVSGKSAVLDSRGRYEGERKIDIDTGMRVGDRYLPFTLRYRQGATVDKWNDKIEVTMNTGDRDAVLALGTQPYSNIATIVFSEEPPLVQLRIQAAATLKHFVPLLGLSESSWRQDPNIQKSWSTSTEAEAKRLADWLADAATPRTRTRV